MLSLFLNADDSGGYNVELKLRDGQDVRVSAIGIGKELRPAVEPSPPFISRLKGILLARIFRWNEWVNMGEVFDSSVRFLLPDGSLLEPSVSWVSRLRYDAIGITARQLNAVMVPEFMAIFLSTTADKEAAQKKMHSCIAQGVKMGWVIIPSEHSIILFREGYDIEIQTGFDRELSGGDVLPGFRFDLKEFAG